jgi:PmbA protein
MSVDEIKLVAEQTIARAKKAGAQAAAVNAMRQRGVDLDWRDGKLEKVTEAVSKKLEVELFVDGRYAQVSTSDLRPAALDKFINDAVALTRTLAPDPDRALPDPELYAGQSSADLQIDDPRHPEITPEARQDIVRAIEAAARATDGKEHILSTDARYGDSASDLVRVASNGFVGAQRDTYFYCSADVSVQDPDGRKPEFGWFSQARHLDELDAPAKVGERATRGAVGRIGSKKGKSAVMPVVIDNRAGGRLVGFLLQAAMGRRVQQKQSFLDGKVGQPIGAARLQVIDNPLRPRGLASTRFDQEGMTAKARPIFDGGKLRTLFLDTYYARKLKLAPTTMRWSNLEWQGGVHSQAELIAQAKSGVFITSFLGGNSNSTTGDFSLGFQGYAIRDGKLAESLSEMNLSGNHLETWKRLAALGNDPFESSAMRTPTLVFEGVQVAGV